MAYYSFIVNSPKPLAVVKPRFAIDEGINTFTALLEDKDDAAELEALVNHLKSEGVKIMEINRLDDHEPGSPEDMLLPGETVDKLLE